MLRSPLPIQTCDSQRGAISPVPLFHSGGLVFTHRLAETWTARRRRPPRPSTPNTGLGDRLMEGLRAPPRGAPAALYPAGYRSDVGALPFCAGLPQNRIGLRFQLYAIADMAVEALMKVQPSPPPPPAAASGVRGVLQCRTTIGGGSPGMYQNGRQLQEEGGATPPWTPPTSGLFLVQTWGFQTPSPRPSLNRGMAALSPFHCRPGGRRRGWGLHYTLVIVRNFRDDRPKIVAEQSHSWTLKWPEDGLDGSKSHGPCLR